MSAILLWLRSEPALITGFIAIATTLSLALSHNDATVGYIAAAVEALGALITRQLVTPSVKLPAAVVAALPLKP